MEAEIDDKLPYKPELREDINRLMDSVHLEE